MKRKSANVDQMQLFVIISKDGMNINADVNAKNSLRKQYVVMDLIGILAIVNVYVLTHVILENTQVKNNVSVEKGQLISYLRNVMKILMRRNYIQIK